MHSRPRCLPSSTKHRTGRGNSPRHNLGNDHGIRPRRPCERVRRFLPAIFAAKTAPISPTAFAPEDPGYLYRFNGPPCGRPLP